MKAVVLGLGAAMVLLLGASPRRVRTTLAPPLPDPVARSVEMAMGVLDRLLPSRRDDRRDRQLPDALDRLSSSLRAGTAIGPALVALARDVPDPLAPELRGVAWSIEHGRSAADALAAWSTTPRASRDVRLVAAALTVGAGAGGEVARAVDAIAATLRERHEVAAEARALATQARASAALLVTAPLVFTVLVATVEPGAVAFLLTTPVGLACLLLGIGLDAGGAVWMARITRGAS